MCVFLLSFCFIFIMMGKIQIQWIQCKVMHVISILHVCSWQNNLEEMEVVCGCVLFLNLFSLLLFLIWAVNTEVLVL